MHEVPHGEEERPREQQRGSQRREGHRARQHGGVERVLPGQVERWAAGGASPARQDGIRGRAKGFFFSRKETPALLLRRGNGVREGVGESGAANRIRFAPDITRRLVEKRRRKRRETLLGLLGSARALLRRRLSSPREDAEQLPRRPQSAARAQEPEEAHRGLRHETLAQYGEELGLARVRGGVPLALADLLHHRRQRGFPQREEEQEIDEKKGKLFAHQTAQRARARQVFLRARRELEHARNHEVDHHQRNRVGRELEHQPAVETAPHARPVKPRVPPPVDLWVQVVRELARVREKRQRRRDEHQTQEHARVHQKCQQEPPTGRDPDVLPENTAGGRRGVAPPKVHAVSNRQSNRARLGLGFGFVRRGDRLRRNVGGGGEHRVSSLLRVLRVLEAPFEAPSARAFR